MILQSIDREDKWLKNIKGNWRDSSCPCGSNFHFNGNIDELFSWERVHLRHMTSDPENHSMLSLYPTDRVIFYHSTSGYTVEIRKHKPHEIKDLQNACLYGNVKLAGV